MDEWKNLLDTADRLCREANGVVDTEYPYLTDLFRLLDELQSVVEQLRAKGWPR